MTMTAVGLDQGGHLDAIRSALRTQVSDIFRQNMKHLGGIPSEKLYDHILDSPQVLHDCFQVFRSQPELFRRIVIRQDKRPVGSDEDMLWCGRSVSDVIRLVVRAAAKRYFRATLPCAPRAVIHIPAPPTRLERLAIRSGLRAAPPPPPPPTRPEGHAEQLYSAFRSHLLFEWQVPLIPHYAPLEVRTVMGLGPRILEFRDPGQLRLLAEEGLTPEGRLPLLLDNAKRLFGPDGGVDGAALREAFAKLNLATVFPALAENDGFRATAVIACMEPKTFQMLAAALGNDLRVVVTFLFAAFARMGEKAFRQALGPTAAAWMLQKLVKHLDGFAHWPRSLPGIRQAAEQALAFAIDLDTGLPAQGSSRPTAAAAPARTPAAITA